jgi:hypothetical protein
MNWFAFLITLLGFAAFGLTMTGLMIIASANYKRGRVFGFLCFLGGAIGIAIVLGLVAS